LEPKVFQKILAAVQSSVGLKPVTKGVAMNVPLKTQARAASRPLAGKVSLITGSTSGIGLGIARALAAAGSDVVLNGFGLAAEIGKTRDQIFVGLRRAGKLFAGRYDKA